MVAEVFPPPDEGTFSWTDSLQPELPDTKTLMGMGLNGIPEDSPAVAEGDKHIPEVLECFTLMVEGSQIFLCAEDFSPEAWEALMNVPFV